MYILCKDFFNYFYQMLEDGSWGSFQIKYGIYDVFREALYNSWRKSATLLLPCSRSNGGNLSGPPKDISEIVSIALMMSSLVILMSESVFVSGYPKKSF